MDGGMESAFTDKKTEMPAPGEAYINRLLNEAGQIPVDDYIGKDEDDSLPPWFDEKLFRKAQSYYLRNIFAMFVGMLCGLISVLAIPSILKVLICTEKSGSPATAYRRYIRTIFHVFTWNRYSSIDVRSRPIQSLRSVRKTHTFASNACQRKISKIISQKDMALTQFGFMGFTTLYGELLGIRKDEQFLEATTHFWRVIGYMLGIKDEFNLCTDSWSNTKERLEAVSEKVFRPALMRSDADFLEMTSTLISGLWSFNPFLSTDTYLFFTRRLAKCDGYEYPTVDKAVDEETAQASNLDSLSTYSRVLLQIMIFVHERIITIWIFRWYFNLQIYLSLFLIYYFPFLAFHRFGWKESYVRIFKK